MKQPTVRIEFKNKPSFIMSLEYYKSFGNYWGFIREHSISPNDIKKVHHIMLDPKDYPTEAWEG